MSRAKVFKHGGGQAVQLPDGFHFAVDEVEIRKDGDGIVLEPVRQVRRRTKAELEALWARIDAIRGDDELVLPEQPRLQEREFD